MSVVAHIVPTVPPEFNGLGDYCYQLWKHWPEPKPEWHVLAARLPEGSKAHWPEVNLHSFELNREDLTSQLLATKADTVVLHYVGYAYAKRGAPTWLPRALEDWKKGTGGKIVTMFHELYASGPPWKSAFWLGGLQKSIVKHLGMLSDQWLTSCELYFRILTDEVGVDAAKGRIVAVGSNIEPRLPVSRQAELPEMIRLVVFGQPGARFKSIDAHKELLRRMFDLNQIECITMVGMKGLEDEVEGKNSELVRQIGSESKWTFRYNLSTTEISDLLATQHIGLLSNRFEILTKSGVFAAYCTHGLVTLIPDQGPFGFGPFLTNEDGRPELCLQAIRASYADRVDLAREWSERKVSWDSIVRGYAEAISA